MIKVNPDLPPSAKAFAHLFTQYRRRSTLEYLEDFGDALAELGIALDDSTFSNWQRGARLPRQRSILLAVIKVLFVYEGITDALEANLLLEAAHQGYLSPDEEKEIFRVERQHAQSPQGPIYLSSIHLVLPSKLLMRIESLAAEQGISRTTLINSILEDKLLQTP